MIYVWFARHHTTFNKIRLQRKSNKKHMHTQAAVPLPQSQFFQRINPHQLRSYSVSTAVSHPCLPSCSATSLVWRVRTSVASEPPARTPAMHTRTAAQTPAAAPASLATPRPPPAAAAPPCGPPAATRVAVGGVALLALGRVRV